MDCSVCLVPTEDLPIAEQSPEPADVFPSVSVNVLRSGSWDFGSHDIDTHAVFWDGAFYDFVDQDFLDQVDQHISIDRDAISFHSFNCLTEKQLANTGFTGHDVKQAAEQLFRPVETLSDAIRTLNTGEPLAGLRWLADHMEPGCEHAAVVRKAAAHHLSRLAWLMGEQYNEQIQCYAAGVLWGIACPGFTAVGQDAASWAALFYLQHSNSAAVRQVTAAKLEKVADVWGTFAVTGTMQGSVYDGLVELLDSDSQKLQIAAAAVLADIARQFESRSLPDDACLPDISAIPGCLDGLVNALYSSCAELQAEAAAALASLAYYQRTSPEGTDFVDLATVAGCLAGLVNALDSSSEDAQREAACALSYLITADTEADSPTADVWTAVSELGGLSKLISLFSSECVKTLLHCTWTVSHLFKHSAAAQAEMSALGLDGYEALAAPLCHPDESIQIAVARAIASCALISKKDSFCASLAHGCVENLVRMLDSPNLAAQQYAIEALFALTVGSPDSALDVTRQPGCIDAMLRIINTDMYAECDPIMEQYAVAILCNMTTTNTLAPKVVFGVPSCRQRLLMLVNSEDPFLQAAAIAVFHNLIMTTNNKCDLKSKAKIGELPGLVEQLGRLAFTGPTLAVRDAAAAAMHAWLTVPVKPESSVSYIPSHVNWDDGVGPDAAKTWGRKLVTKGGESDIVVLRDSESQAVTSQSGDVALTRWQRFCGRFRKDNQFKDRYSGASLVVQCSAV